MKPRIAVAGANGSLGVPTMRLKFYANADQRSSYKPLQSRYAFAHADPLAPQIEHFVAMIRGTAEPLVTVRDGLQNLLVTEAIAEATTSGNVVSVDRR